MKTITKIEEGVYLVSEKGHFDVTINFESRIAHIHFPNEDYMAYELEFANKELRYKMSNGEWHQWVGMESIVELYKEYIEEHLYKELLS